MSVNISNITQVIQWKLVNHLTFAVLMQKISCASRKASMFAISMLFIKDIHLLRENVLILIEITITRKNEVLIKISPF